MAISMFLHVPDVKMPAQLPILFFLHGRKEAYTSDGKSSRDNLFKHGPPKLLKADGVGQEHPLRRRFITICPQLPEAEMSWDTPEVVRELSAARAGIAAERPLYLCGFSRGGAGALALALPLKARKIVAVDATRRARPQPNLPGVPCWLIHFPHENNDYVDIPTANAELIQNETPGGLARRPAAAASQRSVVRREQTDDTNPHTWICEQVFRDPGIYEWLLG